MTTVFETDELRTMLAVRSWEPNQSHKALHDAAIALSSRLFQLPASLRGWPLGHAGQMENLLGMACIQSATAIDSVMDTTQLPLLRGQTAGGSGTQDRIKTQQNFVRSITAQMAKFWRGFRMDLQESYPVAVFLLVAFSYTTRLPYEPVLGQFEPGGVLPVAGYDPAVLSRNLSAFVSKYLRTSEKPGWFSLFFNRHKQSLYYAVVATGLVALTAVAYKNRDRMTLMPAADSKAGRRIPAAGVETQSLLTSLLSQSDSQEDVCLQGLIEPADRELSLWMPSVDIGEKIDHPELFETLLTLRMFDNELSSRLGSASSRPLGAEWDRQLPFACLAGAGRNETRPYLQSGGTRTSPHDLAASCTNINFAMVIPLSPLFFRRRDTIYRSGFALTKYLLMMLFNRVTCERRLLIYGSRSRIEIRQENQDQLRLFLLQVCDPAFVRNYHVESVWDTPAMLVWEEMDEQARPPQPQPLPEDTGRQSWIEDYVRISREFRRKLERAMFPDVDGAMLGIFKYLLWQAQPQVCGQILATMMTYLQQRKDTSAALYWGVVVNPWAMSHLKDYVFQFVSDRQQATQAILDFFTVETFFGKNNDSSYSEILQTIRKLKMKISKRVNFHPRSEIKPGFKDLIYNTAFDELLANQKQLKTSIQQDSRLLLTTPYRWILTHGVQTAQENAATVRSTLRSYLLCYSELTKNQSELSMQTFVMKDYQAIVTDTNHIFPVEQLLSIFGDNSTTLFLVTLLITAVTVSVSVLVFGVSLIAVSVGTLIGLTGSYLVYNHLAQRQSPEQLVFDATTKHQLLQILSILQPEVYKNRTAEITFDQQKEFTEQGKIHRVPLQEYSVSQLRTFLLQQRGVRAAFADKYQLHLEATYDQVVASPSDYLSQLIQRHEVLLLEDETKALETVPEAESSWYEYSSNVVSTALGSVLNCLSYKLFPDKRGVAASDHTKLALTSAGLGGMAMTLLQADHSQKLELETWVVHNLSPPSLSDRDDLAQLGRPFARIMAGSKPGAGNAPQSSLETESKKRIQLTSEYLEIARRLQLDAKNNKTDLPLAIGLSLRIYFSGRVFEEILREYTDLLQEWLTGDVLLPELLESLEGAMFSVAWHDQDGFNEDPQTVNDFDTIYVFGGMNRPRVWDFLPTLKGLRRLVALQRQEGITATTLQRPKHVFVAPTSRIAYPGGCFVSYQNRRIKCVTADASSSRQQGYFLAGSPPVVQVADLLETAEIRQDFDTPVCVNADATRSGSVDSVLNTLLCRKLSWQQLLSGLTEKPLRLPSMSGPLFRLHEWPHPPGEQDWIEGQTVSYFSKIFVAFYIDPIKTRLNLDANQSAEIEKQWPQRAVERSAKVYAQVVNDIWYRLCEVGKASGISIVSAAAVAEVLLSNRSWVGGQKGQSERRKVEPAATAAFGDRNEDYEQVGSVFATQDQVLAVLKKLGSSKTKKDKDLVSSIGKILKTKDNVLLSNIVETWFSQGYKNRVEATVELLRKGIDEQGAWRLLLLKDTSFVEKYKNQRMWDALSINVFLMSNVVSNTYPDSITTAEMTDIDTFSQLLNNHDCFAGTDTELNNVLEMKELFDGDCTAAKVIVTLGYKRQSLPITDLTFKVSKFINENGDVTQAVFDAQDGGSDKDYCLLQQENQSILQAFASQALDAFATSKSWKAFENKFAKVCYSKLYKDEEGLKYLTYEVNVENKRYKTSLAGYVSPLLFKCLLRMLRAAAVFFIPSQSITSKRLDRFIYATSESRADVAKLAAIIQAAVKKSGELSKSLTLAKLRSLCSDGLSDIDQLRRYFQNESGIQVQLKSGFKQSSAIQKFIQQAKTPDVAGVIRPSAIDKHSLTFTGLSGIVANIVEDFKQQKALQLRNKSLSFSLCLGNFVPQETLDLLDQVAEFLTLYRFIVHEFDQLSRQVVDLPKGLLSDLPELQAKLQAKSKQIAALSSSLQKIEQKVQQVPKRSTRCPPFPMPWTVLCDVGQSDEAAALFGAEELDWLTAAQKTLARTLAAGCYVTTCRKLEKSNLTKAVFCQDKAE